MEDLMSANRLEEYNELKQASWMNLILVMILKEESQLILMQLFESQLQLEL
jgi:hypothetical protein